MKIENWNESKEFEPDPTMEEILACEAEEKANTKEGLHAKALAARVNFARTVLGRIAPTDKLSVHQLNNAALDIIEHAFARDARPLGAKPK